MKKLFHTQKHKLPTLLMVLTMLLLSVELFARAGGGGGFGGGRGGGFGGGGFGGSSGSGGSGGGELIFWLIMLVFQHPVVGIPSLIIVVVLFTIGSRQSAQGVATYHQARSISRNRLHLNKQQEKQNLEDLKKKDPSFDKNTFLQRVQQGFIKLQNAWCEQNLNTVRPFISDGISERFQLQFLEQKEQGIRDHMENIELIDITIAQIEFDTVFDTITVKITASAVDYMVNITTGEYVSGSRAPEIFTEYWSFIRRPGTQTISGQGLLEGNCPNCGAPLEINESAKCNSCGSLIKSGEYDWVLSEITQACEWIPQSKHDLPGVKDIRKIDPMFSPQQLEDRVSVIFWRYITAYRKGKIAPLKKMATDSFCNKQQDSFKFSEEGRRTYPAGCAVGSVETLGIALSEPMDYALVKLRWSGKRESISTDGEKRVITDQTISTTVFILVRKHGLSPESAGLSSAHCPNCGAPVSDELSDACQYCGTVMNDGSSDWVLNDIKLPYDPEVREFMDIFEKDMQEEQAEEEKISALTAAAWMIKTMLADNVIDEKEMKLLKEYSQAYQIPQATINSLIESAKNGTLHIPEPQDKEEALKWLRMMARMALSDGFISPAEKSILLKLGQKLNYTAYDIKRIISEERRKIYTELKKRQKNYKQ